ncbi:hypothetical protein LJB78_01065, partial [Bacteroidales bacterium OttesenSCG-928-J16]|nr:hypothetical protein [Bacteroidales bacterium OttesenSCG-928-J16]
MEQTANLEENKLIIKSSAPKIVYNDIVFSNFSLHAQSYPYGTALKTGFDEIAFLQEADSTIVGIEDFLISALMKNDSIRYSISWDRMLGAPVDISFIDGVLNFEEYPKLSMNLPDMSVILRDGDTPWRVKPENRISYDAGNVVVDSLHFFTTDGSRAIIDGAMLKDTTSSVFIDMKNWDLSIVNMFLGESGLAIFGNISGKVALSDIYSDLSADADITIDALRL